ncbi:MAG: hypothetical protein JWM11_6267 [Planctomycetaceae bacterium]|nr:hypothetical protein [Planctomycetaceae bacterium]
MNQHIPGSIEVEGREFFYVETPNGEVFRKIIDEALAGSPEVPLPKSGGVIEEKARILLDGSTSLLGVSYKGDLAGWRAKLVAYCNAKHLKWGIVSPQKLALSDGAELALGECEVIFDR